MKGELSKLQHVFRFQDDLISFNDHGYLVMHKQYLSK